MDGYRATLDFCLSLVSQICAFALLILYYNRFYLIVWDRLTAKTTTRTPPPKAALEQDKKMESTMYGWRWKEDTTLRKKNT